MYRDMRAFYWILLLPLFLLSCSRVEDAPKNLVSLEGYFPVELGDLAPRAVGKIQCAGRKVQWNGDEALSLECPEYALPAAPPESGKLSIQFEAGRVVEIRWEQRLGQAPVNRVVAFHRGLVNRFNGPQVTNVEEEETWPNALTRGEWHHRWSLGNGILYSWFAQIDAFATGKTRVPEAPLYAWVFMAKHKSFE